MKVTEEVDGYKLSGQGKKEMHGGQMRLNGPFGRNGPTRKCYVQRNGQMVSAEKGSTGRLLHCQGKKNKIKKEWSGRVHIG